MRRVVVIGGVAAGMSAASQIKRRLPDVEVVVLEKTRFVSYGSCGIPYYLSGLVKDPMSLIAIPKEKFITDRKIDVRTQTEAIFINPRKKEVIAKDADKEYLLSYDKLVIATGARPARPDVKGLENDGIFLMRDLEDGIKIGQYIANKKPKSALIYGGGYIAMEMSEAFRALGLELTVVVWDRLMGREEGEIVDVIRTELLKNGVRLEEFCAIKSFERNNGTIRADTDRGAIDADIVIVATGVVPNSELAKDAGLELSVKNSIATDKHQRTSDPDIYSAGDCADAYHIVTGKKAWIPLGSTANKQGRVAGANIAGEDIQFPGVVGTATFKVFDLEVARTGLTEAVAKEEGFSVGTVLVDANSRAHYYPNNKPIRIKLVFDTRSGRLLGAHMAGGEGVSKRIDIFATALHANMTIDDIAFLDLSYAPPFAPVWDPVLVAAQVASKKVNR